MSSTSNRRAAPGSLTGETVGLLVFVLVTVVGGGGLYAAVRLGHQLDGTADTLPSDPFAVVIGLFTGTVAWPASGIWISAAAGVLLARATALADDERVESGYSALFALGMIIKIVAAQAIVLL